MLINSFTIKRISSKLTGLRLPNILFQRDGEGQPQKKATYSFLWSLTELSSSEIYLLEPLSLTRKYKPSIDLTHTDIWKDTLFSELPKRINIC